MKNVFMTKMTAPNLKAKAEGNYDKGFAEKKGDAVLNTETDSGSKRTTDVEKKVEAPVEEVKPVAEAKPEDCMCSVCQGTGRVAKQAEEPKEKMEDPKEKMEGGWDKTYAKEEDEVKEEDKVKEEEEETPIKKALRISSMKLDLSGLPCRAQAETLKNHKLEKMHKIVAEGFGIKFDTFAQAFAPTQSDEPVQLDPRMILPNFAKK